MSISNLPSSTLLESIEVHPDNPYLKSVDGSLYSKDGTTLYEVFEDTSYPTAFYSPKGKTYIFRLIKDE